MAAGLQVLNTNGVLQIDQDFSNFKLVQKGRALSASMGNFPANGMGSYVRRYLDITVAGGYPLVALKPLGANQFSDGVGWGVFSVTAVSGGWTIRLCVGSFADIPTACQCDYYVFTTDVGGAASPSGFGLQVFKSDGAIAYDSNFPYLRPLASYNYQSYAGFWTSTPPAGWILVKSGVAGLESVPGKDVALVQVDSAFGWTEDDSTVVFLARSVVGFWETRLVVFGQDYDSLFKDPNVLPLPPRVTVTGRLMAVDVTGL